MSKLKNIIRQLSEQDYLNIFENLMDNSAEKSAMLLKYLKEKQLNDAKIMAELDVNPNAYYTLRSRLNEKIEEYLVKQMESPKTDLLRKVSSINEIMYTKKRTIVVATLKKLEKELIDYDLSNELILVYKSLKKMHINTPEHYYYSQLYNKHVAYMLAIDKAEDILAEYFRKYSHYFLTAEETTKDELDLLLNEMYNVCRLYQSHRLFVYSSCISIFHKIFLNPVTKILNAEGNEITIEDAFEKVDLLVENLSQDITYHHLRLVFDFLKLLFYDYKKISKRGDKHYQDVNEYASIFLSNYSLYTFTPLFLISKIDRNVREDNPAIVLEEFKTVFSDFETDPNDLTKFLLFNFYKAFCLYNAEKFDQCAKSINSMLNEVTLKRYQETQLEFKTFLALQYCLLDDFDLFNQLMNSIQRQIRMLGKKRLEHIVIICKIMKTSLSAGSNRQKSAKIKMLYARINMDRIKYFTPFKYINFKDELLNKLSY